MSDLEAHDSRWLAREGSPEDLVIYTDGACSNNGRTNAQASWGWVMVGKNVHDEIYKMSSSSGRVKGLQTNNRAEMAAVGYALLAAPCHAPHHIGKLVIVSDSSYVLKGLKFWVHGWQKNGWVTKAGTPVKNLADWKYLLKLKESVENRLQLEWIPGHSGDYWNTQADILSGTVLNPNYVPPEYGA